MLINPDIKPQSNRDFWKDELQNLRVLLYEYDRAIADLVSGKISEYRLETGQSMQMVKRTDLSSLYNAREKLTAQIDQLEQRLNGGSVSQILPGW